MKYFVIMVNDCPEYVIPENAMYPSNFKSIDEAVDESAKMMQKKLDREDGITSKWKRKRIATIQEVDGYTHPNTNEENFDPGVKILHIDPADMDIVAEDDDES